MFCVTGCLSIMHWWWVQQVRQEDLADRVREVLHQVEISAAATASCWVCLVVVVIKIMIIIVIIMIKIDVYYALYNANAWVCVSCTQGCIICSILPSGMGARGVSLEHVENMEMFSLFSNLGALWFSENLIRYSLHVCLREVMNNLFSFRHSNLRHFSWRF